MTPTNQSCPICGLENIPSDKDQCPQCDADLSCFKILDSLPDQLQSEPAHEHENTNTAALIPVSTITEKPTEKKNYPNIRIMAVAFFLLLLVVTIVMTLFQFYRFKRLESLLQNYHTNYNRSIASMDTQLKKFVRENSHADSAETFISTQNKEEAQGFPAKQKAEPITPDESENHNDSVNLSPVPMEKEETGNEQQKSGEQKDYAPENLSFWNYSAEETDTLWDISKKYYGSGSYYPVLLQHNPQLSIYNVGSGIDVKILNDTRLAKEIYQKNIFREKNYLYWQYTVMEGDTPRSLATRFYKTGQMASHILDLDDKTQLHPGEKIKIKLK